MKKIVLTLSFLVSLLAGDDIILGEFGISKDETKSMFSMDLGVWYITWEQTSTSANVLNSGVNPLNVNYNIDKAPSATLEFSFNYEFLSSNLEYFNADGASGFDFDMSLIELIPYLNFEARYVKADFKGVYSYSGYVDPTLDGHAEFESPLEIIDLIVYPFNKYAGFGYRTYNYEMPQDFYLIKNSTGTHLPVGGEVGGLSDMQYNGNFYTVALDNKKEVSSRMNYNGLVYSAMYGIGTLTPKNLTYSNLDIYTADLDATFFDIEVGYSYKAQFDGNYGLGLGIGYRYNKIDTTANKSDEDYSLMTEFNSEFHGPYLNISMNF